MASAGLPSRTRAGGLIPIYVFHVGCGVSPGFTYLRIDRSRESLADVFPSPASGRGFGSFDRIFCGFCKSGAHIWGGGMHHDPLLSNYGRGSKLVKFFCFGHNLVILSVCVALPWNTDRVIAIPFMFRLYRSKKYCPKHLYRKRTELARQMVVKAAGWLDEQRIIFLVGDTEYACENVVKHLPDSIVFIGPMNMDAALYAPALPRTGRGRKPKKGKRLLSPRQLCNADNIPWQSRTLILYGKKVQVLIKEQMGLWYQVAGTRLVCIIVTRDPTGRIEDRAYFSTDHHMTTEQIARSFSYRWSAEEMHHNVKQYLGLQVPQNGWWRRPKGNRHEKKVCGPQPHKERGQKAVEHTVPFALTVYALTVLWYLAHGDVQSDVARARRRAPWYRHKVEPSFGDMLASLRRHLWAEMNLRDPGIDQGSAKIDEILEDLLCAA